jgi:hypothetical protein
MHFDCGSFVRYCFRTVLGPALVRPGIQMHDLAQQVWPSSSSSVSLGDAGVLSANIVYSKGGGHVGFTTGKLADLTAANGGTGIPAEETVHAFYAKMGVVKTKRVCQEPVWGEVRHCQKWS